MQVKIGVLRSTREITFESEQSPEEVESALRAALQSGDLLRLQDSKGSTIIVPAAAVAYVELGAPKRGGVGFGSL